MSMSARKELLARVRSRYENANRAERHRILDEYVNSSGHHRKYAITLLCGKKGADKRASKQRNFSYRYDESVRENLIFVWKAANEICAKRLIPFLPTFVESLETSGHLQINPTTKTLLLSLSSSTADRLLKLERAKRRQGKSTTQAGKLLKKQIPIRTFSDWIEKEPGFLEGDLVAHCGMTTRGTYLNTLTLTDIFTGWTECLPLLLKSECVKQ